MERTFEIAGIEGDTLRLAKKEGIWPYKLKGEITDEIMELLHERINEGWNPLAIGTFEAIDRTLPNGKKQTLFLLKSLGL